MCNGTPTIYQYISSNLSRRHHLMLLNCKKLVTTKWTRFQIYELRLSFWNSTLNWYHITFSCLSSVHGDWQIIWDLLRTCQWFRQRGTVTYPIGINSKLFFNSRFVTFLSWLLHRQRWFNRTYMKASLTPLGSGLGSVPFRTIHTATLSGIF